MTEGLLRQNHTPTYLALLRSEQLSYKKHIFREKAAFFRTQLDWAKTRPMDLYNIIKQQTTLTSHQEIIATNERCEEIGNFFSEKSDTSALLLRRRTHLHGNFLSRLYLRPEEPRNNQSQEAASTAKKQC